MLAAQKLVWHSPASRKQELRVDRSRPRLRLSSPVHGKSRKKKTFSAQ
jgi:hypothetical protein